MGNKRRSVYCQHIETEHAYRYVFRHKKEKSDFGVYTGNTFWFHVFALLNYIQTLGETRYSSYDYGLKKARSMWLSMPDLERVRQPDVQPSLYKLEARGESRKSCACRRCIIFYLGCNDTVNWSHEHNSLCNQKSRTLLTLEIDKSHGN